MPLQHDLLPSLADHPLASQEAPRHGGTASRYEGLWPRSRGSFVEGREIQLLADAFESALDDCAAQSEAKARGLRTEAGKLAAFCIVVRAAAGAPDREAFAEVSRAASKTLCASRLAGIDHLGVCLVGRPRRASRPGERSCWGRSS